MIDIMPSLYKSESDCKRIFKENTDYYIIYHNFNPFDSKPCIVKELHIVKILKADENYKTILLVRFKDKEYESTEHCELIYAFRAQYEIVPF